MTAADPAPLRARSADTPAAAPKASYRQEFASLGALALPLALAQAGQALMGMVDTAVLGRLSAAAQGAAGLGSSLSFTILYLGMGVMMGLDPLISQAVGAGRQARARSLYWQGVWLAIVVSVALAPVLVALPFLLESLGIEAEVARGAATYVWWRLPGVPAVLLFVAARSYLQGVGRPRGLFIAMVFANLANFGLDLLLVFGAGPVPAFGVAGAAAATSLCGWLQFGFLTLWLGRAPPETQRSARGSDVAGAARVGLPVGLHLLVESGVFSLAGVLAGRLGPTALAAHQVALAWASVSFCVAVGCGAAATVRVGWGVGGRDTPSARRSGVVAFVCGGVFMAAAGLLYIIAAGPLARVMTSQPEVLTAASSLLAVTAVFQISDGIQAVGAGALRGAGDTRFAFWANLIGHWVIGLPVAVLLGVWGPFGVVGVWWGLSAGLTAVAVAVLLRFLALTRGELVPLERR